jgi:hypothetical protein
MRLIKDSMGRKSWHLTLAVPALIAGTVWFLIGGIDITLPNGYHILTATKTGTEYLLYIGPWLSALGWRDYIKGATVLSRGQTLEPEPTQKEGN